MQPLRDNQSYYDEFARTYEDGRQAGYHALIDDLEADIVASLAGGGRVLEAGCGTGLILERLRAAGARPVGIDLSRGMLGPARARGLPVVQASVTALPIRDGALDATCSFKVLAHVRDIRAALAEMARVTRPGGHVVAEFYNRRSLRYLSWRLRRGAISQTTTEKQVFCRYDGPDAMRGYLGPELEVREVRGVRVVTPHAALHRLPGVGAALAALERWAARAPILRGFGGFLVLVARKRG